MRETTGGNLMGSTDPIAYTYEADHHCPECAAERFGRGEDGFIASDSEDAEGNPIGAVFSWDEWWDTSSSDSQTLNCGDCGAELAEVKGEDDKDIWQLLEDPAPRGCDAVQDLYSWSLNYDAGKGPFALFLDLIGWSEDELGEPIYSLKDASLGYLELSKLAGALSEYADAPHDVRAYVDRLMAAESRG